MITKISGSIDEITQNSVIIECGGMYYSISMAPCMIDELRDSHNYGDRITLYTLYYIEGGVGVGNLVPRLVGFFREDDRRFFEIFTTVKGLGEKKALQALTAPVSHVASAVENGDVLMLKKLPGIGGRMAEKIIAELRGKLTLFTAGAPDPVSSEGQSKAPPFEQSAIEILMSQLGYKQAEAEKMVREVIQDDPGINSVEELIQKIYSRKTATGNA